MSARQCITHFDLYAATTATMTFSLLTPVTLTSESFFLLGSSYVAFIVTGISASPLEELFYCLVDTFAVVGDLELEQAFVDVLAEFYRLCRWH
jgi:hypothetical protein